MRHLGSGDLIRQRIYDAFNHAGIELPEDFHQRIEENYKENAIPPWWQLLTEHREVIAAIVASGHDGLIQKENIGQHEADAFVVWRGAQIKSAIGNPGTFATGQDGLLDSTGNPLLDSAGAAMTDIPALRAQLKDPAVSILDKLGLMRSLLAARQSGADDPNSPNYRYRRTIQATMDAVFGAALDSPRRYPAARSYLPWTRRGPTGGRISAARSCR